MTWLFLFAQLAGVLLLRVPSRTFATGLVDCPNWPAPEQSTVPVLFYLVGLAFLAVGWLGLLRRPPRRLAVVMLAAVLVHACALTVSPFLSQDPLFYSAIGRALALHQDPYRVAIGVALPAGDPFGAALPDFWRAGTSAYSPGFHLIARGVVAWAGDSLERALLGFRIVGAASMLLSALLAAFAARAPRAAVMVAFCPLAIVDGTISAHNDGLLAVCTALFALAITRGRPRTGIGALALGLLVKPSALLLVGFDALRRALRFVHLRWRSSPAAYVAIALAASAGIVTAVPILRHVTQLFGDPHAPDFCTAFTVECAIRFGVRLYLHAGLAAWMVGIAFRVAGAVLIAWMALRASRDDQPLAWAAALLFAYYLYFSGYSHTWYWLPMLPLLSFADPRLRPAMMCVTITALASYVAHLRNACGDDFPLWQRIAGAAVEEILLNVPTTVLLITGLRTRSALR